MESDVSGLFHWPEAAHGIGLDEGPEPGALALQWPGHGFQEAGAGGQHEAMDMSLLFLVHYYHYHYDYHDPFSLLYMAIRGFRRPCLLESSPEDMAEGCLLQAFWSL